MLQKEKKNQEEEEERVGSLERNVRATVGMQKRRNEGIMDPDDVCLSRDDDDDDAKNKSYANWPSFLASLLCLPVKGKKRRHSSFSCFSSSPHLLRIFFFFSPSFKVVSIASRILFPSLFIMKSSWFPTARLSFIPGSDPCSKITVLCWTSSLLFFLSLSLSFLLSDSGPGSNFIYNFATHTVRGIFLFHWKLEYSHPLCRQLLDPRRRNTLERHEGQQQRDWTTRSRSQ